MLPAYFIALLVEFLAFAALLVCFFLVIKKGKDKPTKVIVPSRTLTKAFQNAEEKLVDETRLYTQEAEHSFEEELSGFRNTIEQNFEKELHTAITNFNLYLEELKNESQGFQKEFQKKLEEETLARMEKTFAQSGTELQNNQEKIQGLFDQELKTVKDTIAKYKETRIKAIDDQIVAVIEETLKHFLTKRMSTTQHVDAIYESLAQAKAEKFIT